MLAIGSNHPLAQEGGNSVAQGVRLRTVKIEIVLIFRGQEGGVSMGEGLHRQRSSGRVAAWALLLLVASATSAFAQFDRGTISGTIKDAQGGVVPGVTVTATSTQTQQTRSTVTDGSGFYTFVNLQPGRYDISAELQGFKKVSRQGVQLDAAAALNLDFGLETGALTEEVTVTAEASLLQTDVAVRKTVEAKDIELLDRKS